jgi:2'-5' RNA ligase|uniref:Probable 2'-5' RNA ligase n=1 Tax=Leptospirillum sp. Group II '5-way CG' TaxID=419541 RepID=B6AN05_9BACT|nr:MAG: Probable 2'-5' RNA ligase [Leptospirillum sp. Group II '5-way CG']
MRTRNQDLPSGRGHTLLRRVFIGLYPTQTGLDQVRQIANNLPRSLPLENPEDLHITLLFGGDQPEHRKSVWIEGAHRAQHTLERFSTLPMAGVALERHRSILALRFFCEENFWVAAADVASYLSRDLLGVKPSRPFWPHMTLSRNMFAPLPTGERNVLKKYPLDRSPFLEGVRLWTSAPTRNPNGCRYTALAEFPFQQDQNERR